MNENNKLRPYGFVSEDEIASLRSKDTIFTMNIVSRKIDIKGIGRNKLYALLREKGYLDDSNQALEMYVNEGHFVNSFTRRDVGGIHVFTCQVLVTIKGLQLIEELIKPS